MKLFEPLIVRNMSLKNRVVMAPMGTRFGYRGARARHYYLARARGGVAAIILGGFPIDALFDERFRNEVHRNLVGPIHEYGVKIGPQLWQGNAWPDLEPGSGGPLWIAPSAGIPPGAASLMPVFKPASDCYCRALGVGEIAQVIDCIASAAVLAREMGFDFIEIHACHGHNLAHQFFSPIDNRRTDEYGGDLAGRMRFGLELAGALRAAVGDDFPVFWRHSAEEGLPGGFSLSDSVSYAQQLEAAGVDVFDVSYGNQQVFEPKPVRGCSYCPGSDEPLGTFLPFVQQFKQVLTIPVIAAGRIHSRQIAESVVSDGKADLVAVGRQLLADADWVNKVAAGREKYVKACMSCNNCIDSVCEGKAVSCSINPYLGHEGEYEVSIADRRRRVLVIGGGPAGMEAARTAAVRGHEVTLVERERELGGQLRIASSLPHYELYDRFIASMQHEVEQAGVKVMVGTEATPELVISQGPDVVVLATGIEPVKPSIPGVELSHVVTALDAARNPSMVGKTVVVLGGGLVACAVAEFFALQGKQVTVVRRSAQIADHLYPNERQHLLCRLGGLGVRLMPGVQYKEIRQDGLLVMDRGQRETFISAASIVLAAGAVANNRLGRALTDRHLELHIIGDCLMPRRLANAMDEGVQAGIRI